jgi:hypothetical protein
MGKHLLFYERAVPLSRQRHRNWSLEARRNYAFAGRTNSVPLTVAEFSAAFSEYAIVFAGSDDALQPVVILGLDGNENLFLDREQHWNARYIPAFVRRYPFVFWPTGEDRRLLLCIDEDYAGWNEEGRGQRLLDAHGEPTEFMNRMLGFIENYQRQDELTRRFCRRLQDLELLEPMAARFRLPSGEAAQMKGFLAVDRDRLKALPGATLAELAKSNELELLYLHLQSLRNFAGILSRNVDGAADASRARQLNGARGESPIHQVRVRRP